MTRYDTNQLRISGCIREEPIVSHTAYGEAFMAFSIICRRLSGTCDELPVLAPQALVKAIQKGICCEIQGQIRSYNEYSAEGTHLRLKIFAKQISRKQTAEVNQVILEGHICKTPVYRVTPFGREISDLLLAVNRTHGKSDYIPVIVWGQNARFAEKLQVGQKVRVEGRFQSRLYEKALEDGKVEQRTAYEVSAGAIYLIL